MKIAALMPVKLDLEKSDWMLAVNQATFVCDCVIVLDDHSPEPLPLIPGVTELLRVEHSDGVWNDWANRMTLLARAAKHGCDWAMWLDDDEELGPTLTRDRIRAIIEECEKESVVEALVRVRTMWNATHFRTDGKFEFDLKTFFTKSPFTADGGKLRYLADKTLHHFPVIEGNMKAYDFDYIVHWGLCTEGLRQKNREKYERNDPTQAFSPIPYSYVTNEEGLTLALL